MMLYLLYYIYKIVIMNKMSKQIEESDKIETNWTEKVASFDSLQLKEDLLRGIYAYGFEEPSEIQKLSIKPIIMGRDVIGQARSGTGKTGTFGIGVLENIDTTLNNTQALILAPTRELVDQITRVINNIGTFLNVKVEGFVGGKSLRDDIQKLKKGIHIAVGTPGRIEDLIQKKYLNVEYIKIFIMDEADEMLSKGFIEQVQKIFIRLSEDVQVVLFSATLTNEIKLITKELMKDPVKIFIPLHEQTLEGIPQYYVSLEDNHKFEVIKDLYSTMTIGTTIIFCNSIKLVEELADRLFSDNFSVSTIHGSMTQDEREDKLKQLRTGSTRLLITTDILARGIDVQQLSMVVNYDLPFEPETYIHRIGRCGRFGRKGVAINLVNSRDSDKISFIESHYKTKINELPANLNNLNN
jgi:translation initiation factor 4A